MVSLAPHTHYMCAIIQNLKNLSTADISPVSQQDQSTTIGKKKKKKKLQVIPKITSIPEEKH